MERALSGESIHTHSDIGTSDIDTSDFDNSESEVETMSNQSAEAREADWSSDWDNQGISRQTSSFLGHSRCLEKKNHLCNFLPVCCLDCIFRSSRICYLTDSYGSSVR